MDDDIIKVVLLDVPPRIHGFTVYNCVDGEPCYAIFLNSRLSAEMQREAYDHELQHIKHGDFHQMLPVNQLEKLRNI